jgi:protein-S-isoprenylcysteine O-methyltransferase Ste14
MSARATQWLARRRVALGFVTGAAVLWLASPTSTTWSVGFAVALAGEAVRVWAAGHLEKNREVTCSGPYRWMRHPLYVGSAVIALGVVIAAHSLPGAVVVATYVAATIGAAIRVEEAELRRAFGDAYDRYTRSEVEPMARRFSVARAARNREHRAMAGLLGGFALLALKLWRPI